MQEMRSMTDARDLPIGDDEGSRIDKAIEELAQLRGRFGRLAEYLEETRRDLLQPGRPPTREILRDLEHVRGKFDQLRDWVHAEATREGLDPLPYRDHVTSIDEVAALLDRVREARKFVHRIRIKLGLAQHVVRRVESLATEDLAASSHLEACRRGARHLLEGFSALEEATAAPDDPGIIRDMEDLASGTHPFCLLLALVEQNRTLEDEVWQGYMEQVGRELGRPLALAAARGKLATSAGWQPPART